MTRRRTFMFEKMAKFCMTNKRLMNVKDLLLKEKHRIYVNYWEILHVIISIEKNDTLIAHSLNRLGNSSYSESFSTNQTKLGSQSDNSKIHRSSGFVTHIKNASAVGTSATKFVSATAARVNCLNANATGMNASASASATAARINCLNANATGVNVSASATTDGLSTAVGNVAVTGVDVAASGSASAARVQVGNIDVNGASVGASAKINGTGISAGNIAIGGPSVAASASVDGSLSFGNVNIGLRPSLDIGFGLNLRIPFLSGSKMGSQGNSSDKNGNKSDTRDQNTGALQKAQDYLSAKFPNKRIYQTPVDVSIRPNKDGKEIDLALPDTAQLETGVDNPVVNDIVKKDEQLIAEGMKFVGYKGCQPPTSTTNSHSTQTIDYDPVWAGMYTSPSPAVASGYVGSDDGREVGDIKRVYLPKDAANL